MYQPLGDSQDDVSDASQPRYARGSEPSRRGDGSTGGSKYDKNQELWSVYGVPGTILSILSVLSHIIFHNSELSAVLQMRKQDQ